MVCWCMIHVRREGCQLNFGVDTNWILQMTHKEDCFHLGAKALIHNNEGLVLLLQKNSKPQKHNEQPWDLPGGRIQKNESLEEALKREIHEETGLQNITCINPFTIVLSHIRIPLQEGDVGLIFAVYLCNLADDNQTIYLSDEHLRYDWVNPAEAAKLLAPGYPIELREKIAKLKAL